MLSMRKKLIIIGVAFVAVVAIITAIFACNSKSDDKGTGGKPKNPFTCTVTFDLGDGADGGRLYAVTIDKNTTVARPTKIPQRDGYMFWGWNTTGKDYDPMWKFDVEKITDDMTIYAVWVKTYTVTLYANGGTFDDGEDMRTVTVVEGDKLTEPKLTPPDANMELNSWYRSGSSTWDLSQNAVLSDMELYAIWDLKRDVKRALAPFRYSKTDDGYTINGVVDQNVSGALTVPDIITSIEYAAFSNCPNIVSVVIPDSVTEIGHNAFQNCKKLKSVTFPSGLTSIEQYTFDGCTALENIRLPDTLTELGEYAFRDCSSLKSITVPATCKSTGRYTFKDCTALTSVELHCETVDYDAFYDCLALTSVTFGAEVRTIGSAFKNCMGLTAVEIPNTVTTLYAPFHSCPNLRNVTIGDGVKILYNNAFAYCYNLRNVIIGSGVQEIRSYAFYNCGSLLSITIPSNVETIESYAFSGCYKLVEVYNLSQTSYSFGSSVTVHTDASEESIIHNTDDGFSFAVMNDPYYSPVKQNLFLLDYWGDDEDIVLPDDYNGESYKIARHALAYNPRLKSVRFSAGVISIGDEILLGSDNVTSLTVDSGNTRLSAAGNCVIDYTKSFVLGCKTSVIPDDGSVGSIDSNVFCHNATIVNAEFKIPDSVRYIEQSAFEGCDGIMRTADNGVVYVDKWVYAFNADGSDNQIDLELEAGTVGICDSAFGYNSKYNTKNILRSIKFNAELKYLGRNAFNDCDSLTEVIMNDGLVEVVVGAFIGCDGLQEVVIPDSVCIVGSTTFYGCNNLKYVKLPAGLTSYIDHDMFRDCAALEIVVIPQSVNYITDGAFRGCSDTVKIYYCGTEQQWNAMTINENNDALINATKYFYSETEIEGVNCWHYGADGKPTTEY